MAIGKVKHLKGHGAGTKMDWLCVSYEDEGFGFGGDEAVTCVDMTINAPRAGKPNTVFSVRKGKSWMGPKHIRYDFIEGASSSFEQLAMADEVVSDWDDLGDDEDIELSEDKLDDFREKLVRR